MGKHFPKFSGFSQHAPLSTQNSINFDDKKKCTNFFRLLQNPLPLYGRNPNKDAFLFWENPLAPAAGLWGLEIKSSAKFNFFLHNNFFKNL